MDFANYSVFQQQQKKKTIASERKKKMMRARGQRILSERRQGEREKNVLWEIERLNLSFRFVKMKFDPPR